MHRPLSRFPLAARHDRPLLVVGSCAASLTDELARLGGSLIHFVIDEDALAWLEEETPRAALFLEPPGVAIAGELRDRHVPVLVCGEGGDRPGSAGVVRALRPFWD